MKTSLLACFAIASAIAVLEPGRAEACGGCFVQQTERTVVTDHRMALSVSMEQTVLWDQIRYSGDPAEFAWVLPVRGAAKLELSNDAFFSALDASTQPVVYSPATYGGGFGCGLTGCGSSQADSSSSGPGAGQVQILSQSVVGPYETVTLRATDSDALRNWLKSHAFAIPTNIEPTIDRYVTEKFDFIALRLRPDCGERAMQPVRVVTKGADPTLPLRMVAAGAGAKVGLTLYVISEGRWQAQNFPNAQVDDSKLEWDRVQSRSNYETLSQNLMAEHDGRTWITEYSGKPGVFAASDPRYGGRPTPGYSYAGRRGAGAGATPAFADTYYGLCRTLSTAPTTPAPSGSAPAQPFTPCRNGSDAGVTPPPMDAGVDASQGTDAGADAATEDDAGADASTDAGDDAATPNEAGAPDAAPPEDDAGDEGPPQMYGECTYLDDLDVALRGLHPEDVWVTRLRASLPANALAADDLRLEASLRQAEVSNVHYAAEYGDVNSAGAGSNNGCLSAPKRHTAFGSWVLGIGIAIGGIAVVRRRRRR